MQEDTLSELVKKSGGFALGALIGKGGSKFRGLDIKRVYFGSACLSPCLQRISCSAFYLETGSETLVRSVVSGRLARAVLTDAHHDRL